MIRPHFGFALLSILFLSTACPSPEDRAAKARIFSPEDPPRVLLAAAENLDPTRLTKDPALLERILAISGAEAQARLGPHLQNTTVEFEWRADADEETGAKARQVRLEEKRFVAVGRAGDFHVRIENDERQGMEWVRVGGVAYARSRYARFRERRRDRGSSEHVLTSAYDNLAVVYELMHGAFRLEPAGTKTIGGRRALQYEVKLGEARPPKKEKLPALEPPKDGFDPDTALRLAALEEGAPTALSGTLAVDALTAVPLFADLHAVLKVPAGEGRRAARLELHTHLEVSEVGKDPEIRIPEHIEDAPRPPGVVGTLRAYGLRGEKETPEQPEEPEDELETVD